MKMLPIVREDGGEEHSADVVFTEVDVLVLDIAEEFFKDNLIIKIIQSLRVEKIICLQIKKYRQKAFCSDSLMITPNVNVLKFQMDTIFFLIFQHVSSCDFIYFPSFDELKIHCHADELSARQAIKEYFNLIEANNFLEAQNKRFGGVIASHGRPYHFFYDTVLGMQMLYESGLFSYVKTIYQIDGAGSFLRLEDVYEKDRLIHSESVEFGKLNQISVNQNVFFVKIGCFYNHGNDTTRAVLKRFDDNFNRFSKTVNSALINQIQYFKDNGYFILWHGITVAKRRWIEQEEAIVLLANNLIKLNYKVCLLVDGWTNPISPSNNDLNQVAKDTAVFEGIHNKLDQDVECLSIIGQVPVIKLAVANLIDFYISNGATGSLYTSRMAQKKGILHIAKRSRAMTGLSIHYNPIFLPATLVQDIPNLDCDRDDYISYSIKSDTFYNFFLSTAFSGCSCLLFIKDVFNCEQLANSTFSYRALNNDPIIIFDFYNCLFCTGDELVFNFEVETSLDIQNLKGTFYFDYGNGFSELNILSVEYCNSILSVSHVLPHDLRALRFDPLDCVGDFTLTKANIKIVKHILPLF